MAPTPNPFPVKLTEAVAREYPRIEIGVSFSNEWELVHSLRSSSKSLYMAGLPPSLERSRGDHFYGLSPEINRSLTTCRLYKLLQPWMTPLFQVACNSYLGEGRIISGGRSKGYGGVVNFYSSLRAGFCRRLS